MTRRLTIGVLACLAWAIFAVEGSQAASPVSMTATTPFTQSKATDATGAISYRVGGVFAAAGGNPARLSLTAICSSGGGPLALLIVRTSAPAALKSGAAAIVVQVDGLGTAKIAGERTASDGLASYQLKPDAQVESLVSAMAGGQKLLIELDEFSAELPLAGFAAEMKDLTAACSHR